MEFGLFGINPGELRPNTIYEHSVTLAKQYDGLPTVLCTIESNSDNPEYGNLLAFTSYLDSTSFKVRVANASATGSFTPVIKWVAIGKRLMS